MHTTGICERSFKPKGETTELKVSTDKGDIHKLYLVQCEVGQTFHFIATKQNL